MYRTVRRSEEESCGSMAFGLFSVVLLCIAAAALVVGAIGLANAQTANNNLVESQSFAYNLTVSGLGANLVNVPVTIYQLGPQHTLRLPATLATCTANGSIANATNLLTDHAPAVDFSGEVTLFSGGAKVRGSLTYAASGVITVTGTAPDLQIGKCGWSNDILLNYVA